jgi:hypothetical protein
MVEVKNEVKRMMEKRITWKLSERVISYFASSIYGQNFDIVAVRELLQNAIDARAKKFTLRIDTEKDVQVINDGDPMDLTTIENALFTLGESTKKHDDKTGFFGVGECAVIAPCETWKIESGKYVIENFILRENNKYVNGTVHTLKLKNGVNGHSIKRFLEYHDLPIKINIVRYGQTETIARKSYPKCRKYDIPHGKFTWVKSGDCYTVIRVKGLPQYKQWRFDNCGTFIIDVDTSTILTVNRETIKDEETSNAVNKIQEEIKQIAEHVSGDQQDVYLTISQNPLVIRKKGIIPRRDLNSKPVRKLYNCLKIVNDFYQTKLNATYPIGLMFNDKDVLAMVHEGTIYLNIQDLNMFPSTTFALKLVDYYTHELAHLRTGAVPHSKTHAELREIAYNNPKIYTLIRNEVRNK